MRGRNRSREPSSLRSTASLLLAACSGIGASPAGDDRASYVPDLSSLLGAPASELRAVVERYSDDRGALLRRHDLSLSPARRAVLRRFYEEWRSRLREIDFESLGREGRVDFALLGDEIDHELGLLDREEKVSAETAPLLPFAGTIVDLHERRRNLEPLDPPAAAESLARLAQQVDATREAVEAGTKSDASPDAIRATKTVAHRAAGRVEELRGTLARWYEHSAGYDPIFTWWAKAPYGKAEAALRSYHEVLREKVVGARKGEDEPIVGDPIGREALLLELRHERIPYGPEELIAIAEREFAWCEEEMRRAAREMGLADPRAALERVKSLHVEPGRQPQLVRELALEAIAFVEERDLVTVPPLAKDVWRMEMLSPEAQKQSPFFLGGEVIRVSFPTDAMEHEDKLMSLRGNNVHFSRATVHHELIPGHHLQGFMGSRHNPHRRAFGTPFWTEGWAFYWETLLWDLGFPRTPEDRVGMLFWRMHRAARVRFSLGFHLGRMSPQECIDLLVDRVGHERANATAEVRRSFAGSYSPLYQCAYMIGGLQFRALRRELVESGRWSDRDFHDAVLRANSMPVERVRALLAEEPIAPNAPPTWKF
jgi:uncharacterized protein (DUF885 family)